MFGVFYSADVIPHAVDALGWDLLAQMASGVGQAFFSFVSVP
jgi:hypothetical protein